MKIGYPTHPRKDAVSEIEWIGQNGFDFVDLFVEEDMCTADQLDADEIMPLLDKYGLSVVGHTAPFLHIGSPNKAIRQAAVAEICKSFPLLSKLKATYVTVHANWPGGMFTSDEGITYQVESLNKIMDEAKKYGLIVIYESTAKEQDTFENIGKILQHIPDLKLHLDVGHMNLFGKNPLDYIERFSDKIVHVHLHDNDGSKDQHLPLGVGKVDYKAVLKLLKEKGYDGTITLEIFSKEMEYILKSKELVKIGISPLLCDNK